MQEAHPLPPAPTDAPPGTLRKIEVMAQRYEKGYQLHHPQDAKRGREGYRKLVELRAVGRIIEV